MKINKFKKIISAIMLILMLFSVYKFAYACYYITRFKRNLIGNSFY